MRELFRLSGSKLRNSLVRNHGAKDVRHLGRLGKDDVVAEALLVLGHGGIVKIQLFAAVEALESVLDEGSGQLPWAVAPEIEEYNGVPVLDGGHRLSVLACDDCWDNELVPLAG